MLLKLFLFSAFVGFSTQADVQVSIFYESLCPDSIRFLTAQLYPNYETVADYINVDFVPYGKATQTQEDGQWEFQCQHGPSECYGNMMHACALSQTSDQSVQVSFVNCIMGSINPSNDDNLQQCANANGLDWESMVTCSNDGTGSDLLAAHGDRTHAVNPTITFIPTIIYDGTYDADLQNQSLTDFLGTVCKVIGDDVC